MMRVSLPGLGHVGKPLGPLEAAILRATQAPGETEPEAADGEGAGEWATPDASPQSGDFHKDEPGNVLPEPLQLHVAENSQAVEAAIAAADQEYMDAWTRFGVRLLEAAVQKESEQGSTAAPTSPAWLEAITEDSDATGATMSVGVAAHGEDAQLFEPEVKDSLHEEDDIVRNFDFDLTKEAAPKEECPAVVVETAPFTEEQAEATCTIVEKMEIAVTAEDKADSDEGVATTAAERTISAAREEEAADEEEGMAKRKNPSRRGCNTVSAPGEEEAIARESSALPAAPANSHAAFQVQEPAIDRASEDSDIADLSAAEMASEKAAKMLDSNGPSSHPVPGDDTSFAAPVGSAPVEADPPAQRVVQTLAEEDASDADVVVEQAGDGCRSGPVADAKRQGKQPACDFELQLGQLEAAAAMIARSQAEMRRGSRPPSDEPTDTGDELSGSRIKQDSSVESMEVVVSARSACSRTRDTEADTGHPSLTLPVTTGEGQMLERLERLEVLAADGPRAVGATGPQSFLVRLEKLEAEAERNRAEAVASEQEIKQLASQLFRLETAMRDRFPSFDEGWTALPARLTSEGMVPAASTRSRVRSTEPGSQKGVCCLGDYDSTQKLCVCHTFGDAFSLGQDMQGRYNAFVRDNVQGTAMGRFFGF